MNRRRFLLGALSAPAVITTPGLLMPVKALVQPVLVLTPDWDWWGSDGSNTVPLDFAHTDDDLRHDLQAMIAQEMDRVRREESGFLRRFLWGA